MKYPIELRYDPFLGEVEREMTPQEYEDKIQWFRDFIKRNENDTSRRGQEYVSYLRRWFSDKRCDGVLDFKTRYAWRTLPMSMNVYFN